MPSTSLSFHRVAAAAPLATAYNAIAIPMAAGVIFGTGLLMTPAVGAGLMSASTIIVAINAQLLRFYRKKG
jgi:Cu2+-exporting ATPase